MIKLLLPILLLLVLSCNNKCIQRVPDVYEGYYYTVVYYCSGEEHVTTINVDYPHENTIDLLWVVIRAECHGEISKFQIVHSWEDNISSTKTQKNGKSKNSI